VRSRSIGGFAAVLLMGAATAAHAGIINTTGAVQFVASPPPDVSSNQWESNTIIRAFDEVQSLQLPQDVAVDITVPGTSPNSTSVNLSPGVIPAGTVVSSYALHYDVIGTRATDNALEAIGSVSFSDPILGIEVLSATLNGTNGTLGLASLTYSNGPDHGLELTPGGGGTSDVITLSADDRTVTVDLLNASSADDVRIITAASPTTTAVPLPAAFYPGAAMMTSLLAAAYGWRKRSHILTSFRL
jgi:hypothetical protein